MVLVLVVLVLVRWWGKKQDTLQPPRLLVLFETVLVLVDERVEMDRIGSFDGVENMRCDGVEKKSMSQIF